MTDKRGKPNANPSYVIRRERQYAGLTLRQLGESMGILGNPAQRISQWEAGYRSPSKRSLATMEEALGLAPGSLISRAKELENHVNQPRS